MIHSFTEYSEANHPPVGYVDSLHSGSHLGASLSRSSLHRLFAARRVDDAEDVYHLVGWLNGACGNL